MQTIELNTPLPPHAETRFGTTANALPEIDSNIKMLVERLGPIAYMRQVHGDKIAYASAPGAYEETDALFTDRPDLWLAVSTADCLPVLISSPRAVAAIHAGWRGLELELVSNTAQLLMEEFNLDPTDLFVSIGPCIRQVHYEVEPKFMEIFDSRFFRPGKKRGHLLLDLPGVATSQLRALDIPLENINDTGVDTYSDKRFFSYRRSRHEGLVHNVQPSLIRRRGVVISQ